MSSTFGAALAMSNTTLYIMFGSGSSLAPGKSLATSPPGIAKAWPDCAKTEPESPTKAANTATPLKNGVFIMISINTDFCFDCLSIGHKTQLLYMKRLYAQRPDAAVKSPTIQKSCPAVSSVAGQERLRSRPLAPDLRDRSPTLCARACQRCVVR